MKDTIRQRNALFILLVMSILVIIFLGGYIIYNEYFGERDLNTDINPKVCNISSFDIDTNDEEKYSNLIIKEALSINFVSYKTGDMKEFVISVDNGEVYLKDGQGLNKKLEVNVSNIKYIKNVQTQDGTLGLVLIITGDGKLYYFDVDKKSEYADEQIIANGKMEFEVMNNMNNTKGFVNVSYPTGVDDSAKLKDNYVLLNDGKIVRLNDSRDRYTGFKKIIYSNGEYVFAIFEDNKFGYINGRLYVDDDCEPYQVKYIVSSDNINGHENVLSNLTDNFYAVITDDELIYMDKNGTLKEYKEIDKVTIKKKSSTLNAGEMEIKFDDGSRLITSYNNVDEY